MRLVLAAVLGGLLTTAAQAGTLVVTPTTVPEWKAVYGRVEARNTIPARARLGGTLVDLSVTEGDRVTAGQRIATVRDDKLAFQVSALDARMKALEAQMENALSELARGQALVAKGVATTQRLDQLNTQVDVVRNQIAAASAERQVVIQQGAEGDVLAPADGLVLTVPVTRDAVIMAGEPIATIGGGGFFLRLAIPERHAATLKQGATLAVEAGDGPVEGRLAKVYPQIASGRVVADVEVDDLPTAFAGARLLVRVPLGERQALMIPAAAVDTHSGLDMVTVQTDGGEARRTVLLGARDGDAVEVLTGLSAGETLVVP